MGDQVIPRGAYSLWMMPEPTGAKLIVNRQTGQWGTEYDSTKDLARLDLARYTLPSAVEAFTIAVAPRDSGGVLTLSWDQTAFFLPFTVVP